ncbi:MAG: cryptochrome/photolyase family protein [Aureispira sp.]
MEVVVFWLRRDLRWQDNKGLEAALKEGKTVLPLFIYDTQILEKLPRNDARLNFIHKSLQEMNEVLKKHGSCLLCKHGNPKDIWAKLVNEYTITAVYTNKDYEPYARLRDKEVLDVLAPKNIPLKRVKDQVVYEEREVMKKDGTPYTVYTPYKKVWLRQFDPAEQAPTGLPDFGQFWKENIPFLTLKELGFTPSAIKVRPFQLEELKDYEETRNLPARDGTSYLSPHLRFGTISPRQIIAQLDLEQDATFLSELIWREFFMQILYHFPKVVNNNFRAKYDGIQWRNNKKEFEQWCQGKTGYPMVDAGMRQLNKTGYMHNRVRMVTASFLCKHLLIDWRWGEAYFAEKLLDYDLSSNNGNWQWAAGTGCDASPYFRVFNPITQLDKFDKDRVYVKEWIEDLEKASYPEPMVEHKEARLRAIARYKEGILAT